MAARPPRAPARGYDLTAGGATRRSIAAAYPRAARPSTLTGVRARPWLAARTRPRWPAENADDLRIFPDRIVRARGHERARRDLRAGPLVGYPCRDSRGGGGASELVEA